MKKILTLCLIALAAAGCRKDETLRFNNITMGNVDLGAQTIVSDQGNTFDIKESLFHVDLSSYKYGRVMLICDILRETSENRYDIRVTGMESVLAKPTVSASTITGTEDPLSVEDAINIKDIWYGGGYLNMMIEFAQKKASSTKHFINLIHDDTAESEVYTFVLRHNAYGETPKEDDRDDFRSVVGYVSFPVANLITEDKAKITISWKSHKILPGGGYSLLETEEMSRTYDWERLGYEHPQNVPVVSANMR